MKHLDRKCIILQNELRYVHNIIALKFCDIKKLYAKRLTKSAPVTTKYPHTTFPRVTAY